MATRDYSDDDDFFSQGFEKKGTVSVWISLVAHGIEANIDTLQDLCGVGYYRLSDQEKSCQNNELVNISQLFTALSYSSSFKEEAIASAKGKGIEKARAVTVQYDFEYDPGKIARAVAPDPIFLGVFNYAP